VNYPQTHFAAGPEGQVAYQIFGSGSLDLLFLPPWIWSIEVMWENPRIERFLKRLAGFSRVIVYDKRGTGVSDPVPLGAIPTIEQWADDIGVVLDAAGCQRAAIVANMEAVQMALIFAAMHPERSSALVTLDGAACYLRHDDFPIGMPEKLVDRNVQLVMSMGAEWPRFFAPSLAEDTEFKTWFARFRRLAVAPSLGPLIFRTGHYWDVRAALPAITVPTLVIHHTDNQYFHVDQAHYLASQIRDAKLVQVPGVDGHFYAGDQDASLGEIEAFLTGERTLPEEDRVLATVLFTDIVNSTKRSAEMGDKKWREALDAHDKIAASQVGRQRGRLIKTTGDGVLATFDGPARAIKCACALGDEIREKLGLEIRSGLHTGEIELRGKDIGGIAVALAARVMSEAGPLEVVVSSTVKDLVVGSGIEFDQRGRQSLKGVPGEWRLYLVRQ
jgi:class 3 adenylate cyclase